MEKTRAEIIEEIMDAIREYGDECRELATASEWGTPISQRAKDRAFNLAETLIYKAVPE